MTTNDATWFDGCTPEQDAAICRILASATTGTPVLGGVR